MALRAAAARCVSTTPGSTWAVDASSSMWWIRVMQREKSRMTPSPIALPAIDVPPPRAVRGVPR
ncbi:Uncharacterised protein [Mycobacteroides abscessus subsp. abscessus]|nr:Uncharacterised protein [Mycobacteroides abscessus subsp. abscessus]